MPVQRVTAGGLTDVAEQTNVTISKRRSAFLIYASSAVLGCSIALFGALSTWIQSDLELSQSEAGFTQAVFFCGHLSGALLLAMTLSRWALSRNWLLAVSCTMLGSFLCGSPSYALILAGRFLAGLGLSSTIIISTRCLTELFPNASSRALNLLHALIAATAALTFMTARQLAEVVDSWECSFLITGLLAVVPVTMAVIMPLRLADKSNNSNEDDLADKEGGLTQNLAQSRWLGADVLVLLPIVIGYVAVEQSFSLFLPASLETRFGLSATAAANVGAIFWFGIIAGRVGSSFISNKIDDKKQLFWGALLMGGCLLSSLRVESPLMMQALVFLGGVMGGPLVPLGFATTSKLAGSNAAKALIACQLSCCCGGMTGPFGVGVLADKFGLVTSLSVYCVLIMVAVLPLLLLTAWSRLTWESLRILLAPLISPEQPHGYEPIRESRDRRHDPRVEPSTLSSHLVNHPHLDEDYTPSTATKC
ncbi:putative transporter [Polystyrenella longa]|uniref:Putative transporter n=1 Tax=Polystyrenella longa TaxID=2528007 RepID=A0A518CJE5_9PLAN|nr:MFS transporter [Polystyrenella longa]QDU79359.1 putative transporter [Polystyrenella longa]